MPTKVKNLIALEEPFVEEEYPDFEEALIDYADEYDVYLDESDIEILSDKIDIDGDGYPYIENNIRISKYKCEVLISAYHHSGWDFYVEDFKFL